MTKVMKPKATPRRGKHATGQRVGYMCVSTLDQVANRQIEGFKLDRTFLDKASSKDVHRPKLIAMLAFVREDDTVICHSMDRLSRNRDDLHRHDRSWRLIAVRQREPDVHRAGFADGEPCC